MPHFLLYVAFVEILPEQVHKSLTVDLFILTGLLISD